MNEKCIEYTIAREKAWDQISEKYAIRCICGRLCTGLHKRTCKKFQDAVARRTKKLLKISGWYEE